MGILEICSHPRTIQNMRTSVAEKIREQNFDTNHALMNHSNENYNETTYQIISYKHSWSMVWNMTCIFPSIGNVIIPSDFYMFQRD